MEHLCSNSSAALFYDPGLGKTSTTLAAFKLLQEHGVAHRALVIAPVRVCQLVWEQEAAGWTQFKDMRFANMAGKSAQIRKNQLQANADIWLINPESVPWLARQFMFTELPFDTLVIDELTKFKNTDAGRSKMLQPLANKIARKWGLTGSPAPNGYEDLFGQMKILDGGACLGQYITQYRDRFFQRPQKGFKYDLRPGADLLIQEKLRPYVHALRAEDYLTLPPLIEHEIAIELDKPTMAQYRHLKKQMVLDLPDGSITAVNAAALGNKLTQFTGGAVYSAEGAWSVIHTAKIDALEELVEELQGQQLLVAYHYNHELERLLERFPEARYIGSGVTEKQVREIEEDWNAGRLKLLFGHPQSMGHGLNMQKSGAGHICWFTQTWDFELYDQFIKRVLRQGNTAERIVNHRLVAVDTIDKVIGDGVSMKRDEQDDFLNALKAEFIKDDPGSARVFATGDEEVRRITLANEAAPEQAQQATQQQQPATQPVKTGWGGKPAIVNAQTEAQLSKVAGPQVQDVNKAAGGWGKKFTDTPTPTISLGGQHARVEAQNAPQVVDGSFTALEQLQEQVLQPGEMQPQFAIQTGGERVEQEAPFEGGQPATEQPTQAPRARRARKTAVVEATPKTNAAAAISFDIGQYIAQRIAQGESFVNAQNEAAQIVESLEG